MQHSVVLPSPVESLLHRGAQPRPAEEVCAAAALLIPQLASERRWEMRAAAAALISLGALEVVMAPEATRDLSASEHVMDHLLWCVAHACGLPDIARITLIMLEDRQLRAHLIGAKITPSGRWMLAFAARGLCQIEAGDEATLRSILLASLPAPLAAVIEAQDAPGRQIPVVHALGLAEALCGLMSADVDVQPAPRETAMVRLCATLIGALRGVSLIGSPRELRAGLVALALQAPVDALAATLYDADAPLELARRVVAGEQLIVAQRFAPLERGLAGLEDEAARLIEQALRGEERLRAPLWVRAVAAHAGHPLLGAARTRALMPLNERELLREHGLALAALLDEVSAGPALREAALGEQLLRQVRREQPAELLGALALALRVAPARAPRLLIDLLSSGAAAQIERALEECGARGTRALLPTLRAQGEERVRYRRALKRAEQAITAREARPGDAAGALELAEVTDQAGALSLAGEAGALTLASPTRGHGDAPRPAGLIARLRGWLSRVFGG